MNKLLNIKYIGIIIFNFCAIASPCQQKKPVFYVALTGSSNNTGSITSPFQSLDDATRTINNIIGPIDATVYMRGGNYHFSRSFLLLQSGSDTSRHITFSGYNHEKVTISGSSQLHNNNFHLVTDPVTINRLPVASRGKVYEIDLQQEGITNYGKRVPHGYKNISPSYLELFYNDSALPVARWPNTGLASIGKVFDPGTNVRRGEKGYRGPKFTVADDRINNWKTADNAWIGGYFSYGYSDDYMKVDSIDLNNNTIRLKDPAVYTVFSNDDASTGELKNAQAVRGFYIYNLLEELDAPGEWYLDEKVNKLYLWPGDNLLKSADIEVSQLEDPIVVLSQTDNITFKGIAFKYCRGMGLLAENTRNTKVLQCVFANLGTAGISTGNQLNKKRIQYQTIAQANNQTALYNTNLLVESCLIYNTGTGGIILDGGDRKNLIPANNRVDNCEIYNFSRINKTYCPGVALDGEGNQVTHCYIHDAPDQAILFSGNDHQISYNHFKNVASWGADMGAVYTGLGIDLSSAGNIISYNFFDNIISSSNSSVCAVYLDNAISNVEVSSNIFYKAGTPGSYHFGAIHANGGGNNYFKNNYFIDCYQAISNSPWNDKAWLASITGANNVKRYYADVDIRSDPYVKKYPQLTKLADSNKIAARQNYSLNSLAYDVNVFATALSLIQKNTYTTNQDPGFADAARGNFALLKLPSELERANDWKPIPFNKIGPTK